MLAGGYEQTFTSVKCRMKALTPLSDFEHGFVTAVLLAARLGDRNLAAKMLGNASFQALDCPELNAGDKQQFLLVDQQPGMKLTGHGRPRQAQLNPRKTSDADHCR